MGHVLEFKNESINELVIENRKKFYELVNDIIIQAEGTYGGYVLSIEERPVEISRYIDVILQFAPFQINRKGLLTKLYAELEKKAMNAENYMKTVELLGNLELYIQQLSDDICFDIDCTKVAIGPIIRALSPEFCESNKSVLEKVFAYMEMVRELDRERLFVMVNMRTYFSYEDMESFAESVSLHDFNVLLLESTCLPLLKNTKRYIIDEDLCEI